MGILISGSKRGGISQELQLRNRRSRARRAGAGVGPTWPELAELGEEMEIGFDPTSSRKTPG